MSCHPGQLVEAQNFLSKSSIVAVGPVLSDGVLSVEQQARSRRLMYFFLWLAPVAFRRVALETPEWTSRGSNHHRQSVSAGKTNAIPTEPSGRLVSKAYVHLKSCVSRQLQVCGVGERLQ